MTEAQFREVVGVSIGEASTLFGFEGKGEFDSEKAIAIMERIIAPYYELLTKVDFYESSEQVKYAVRQYAELCPEDRAKIDNFIKAFQELNKEQKP
jgi:hypothetical protein